MTTGRVTVRGNRALLANFSFISGGRSDLRSLLRFHYRAAMPATVALVLCAFERERGGEGASRSRNEPAAVLCVSYPVLNAPWRAVAWPELLNADARTLNACVRCISRVVVDPRYRGIGLSSELVRRYLRTPITVYTESLAAMGGACPFLRAAGMREIELKRSARDERLLRDLRRLGLNPARALCEVQVIEHRVRLGRKVRACALRWAKASKATARGAETRTTTELLQEACGALRPTRLVYVHTSGASESNTSINQGEGGE